MKQTIQRILDKHRDTHITRRQIAAGMNLDPEQKNEFRRVLRELLSEGALVKLKKNYYLIRGRSNTATGKLQCHRSGFGFVIPDPDFKGLTDIFVPASQLGDAVHGDRVLVEYSAPKAPPRGRRPSQKRTADKREGKVLRILERGHSSVIGRILFLKQPVVIPIDSRIHYSVKITSMPDIQLENEDVVKVELLSEPSTRTRPQGQITALIARADDPDLPLKIAMAKHNIPSGFPPEVLAAADAAESAISAEEIKKRKDLRDLPAVTIDGETAFDYDDAVNVERLDNGDFRLWIHIADVSHYVPVNSIINQEAFNRGTSTYFPDRAIPMLPERLSSGICSLLPNEDRLAFSAELLIDGASGKTRRSRFTPSVIRSRARMTYTQVAAILNGDAATRQQYSDLLPDIERMSELMRLLNRKRRQRGAIDFDLPEEEVRFDTRDNVIGIFKSERNVAHRIVEEFMLAANEAVAAFFIQRDVPGIYRIHEPPDPVKLMEFATVANQFGHSMETGLEEYHPRVFQQLADGFEEGPLGRYLTYLMLRSFKLAIYSEQREGHFGLAADHYTHFTSPIRRYPDLIVHRLLRNYLGSKQSAPVHSEEELAEFSRHSTERERAAVEAEREVLAWKKAEFMQQHVGEEFIGFISGMRPNGFWVELAEFYIEGFVNLASISEEYFEFFEESLFFRGEQSGRTFRLGTQLVVLVDRVDMQRYQLDFSVVRDVNPETPSVDKKKPPAKKKPTRKRGGPSSSGSGSGRNRRRR